MRGICPATVAKTDSACKTAVQLLYTFILFILFIFPTDQHKHFSTSGNVISEPRFSHAPYIGSMNEKRGNTAYRIYKSQRAAIRQLCWIREKNRLSQTEVAKRMGSSVSVIWQIETGKTDPKLSTLRRYAIECGGEIAFSVSES